MNTPLVPSAMGSSVSHSKEAIPEKSIKSEKKEKIDVEIGDARGSQSYVQRVLGLQVITIEIMHINKKLRIYYNYFITYTTFVI